MSIASIEATKTAVEDQPVTKTFLEKVQEMITAIDCVANDKSAEIPKNKARGSSWQAPRWS